MSKKLEIVEFRGVGGLQGRQEAKDQAIYDNFKAIIDELNRLNGSDKPKKVSKKEESV